MVVSLAAVKEYCLDSNLVALKAVQWDLLKGGQMVDKLVAKMVFYSVALMVHLLDLQMVKSWADETVDKRVRMMVDM